MNDRSIMYIYLKPRASLPDLLGEKQYSMLLVYLIFWHVVNMQGMLLPPVTFL